MPAALLDAHIKHVEASTADGKYDPSAGLVQVNIFLDWVGGVWLISNDTVENVGFYPLKACLCSLKQLQSCSSLPGQDQRPVKHTIW